jgi:hypothetical protein
VVDQWHLWKNLCDSVESTVRTHRADLREPEPESAHEPGIEPSARPEATQPDSRFDSTDPGNVTPPSRRCWPRVRPTPQICTILGLSDKDRP